MNWLAESIVVLWFLPVVAFIGIPLLTLALHTLLKAFAGLTRVGRSKAPGVVAVGAKS